MSILSMETKMGMCYMWLQSQISIVEHWKRTKIDKFNEIIGEIHVGDRVYGRCVGAGIPDCGAIVSHEIQPDSVYVNHIDGSGLGIRIKTDLSRYSPLQLLKLTKLNAFSHS